MIELPIKKEPYVLSFDLKLKEFLILILWTIIKNYKKMKQNMKPAHPEPATLKAWIDPQGGHPEGNEHLYYQSC